MEAEDIQKKIKDYEYFIEEKLKTDLRDVETVLREKTRQYNDWEDVKKVVKVVEEFKEKDRDMSIQLDVGCGVHAFAEITEYEPLYITIGLGYMLEMDREEANKYSDIRLKLLKKEIDHYRKLAVTIKVHVKMTLLAIRELQDSLLTMNKLTLNINNVV